MCDVRGGRHCNGGFQQIAEKAEGKVVIELLEMTTEENRHNVEFGWIRRLRESGLTLVNVVHSENMRLAIAEQKAFARVRTKTRLYELFRLTIESVAGRLAGQQVWQRDVAERIMWPTVREVVLGIRPCRTLDRIDRLSLRVLAECRGILPEGMKHA